MGKEYKRSRGGIQGKLLAVLLPVVFLVLGVILALVYWDTSKIVLNKSEELLEVNTESVVHTVEAWMKETLTALEMQRDTVEYFNMEPEKELEYIKHTANLYDSYPAGLYLATTAGKLIHASFVPGPEFNVFEKPWYQDGMKSEDFIFGSVYFDEDSRNYVVGASGVLKDSRGTVRGVAAADIYLNAISDIVRQVKIEETGGTYLVDGRTDVIIGHASQELVGAPLGEQGGMYQFAAEQISSGTAGLTAYEPENGEQIYLNVEKVPGSDWVAISYVPRTEVLHDINKLTRSVVALAVFALVILTGLIMLLVKKSIVAPVRKIDHVAKRIADGHLDETIDYQSGDELGALAANFNKTAVRLRSYVDYIKEISQVLNEIAKGNLDFSLALDYTGEFATVRNALNYISEELNETMGQINIAADQVASGSSQVSSGAQDLSEGATQQAGAVEELASAVSEVSSQVEHNANDANRASCQVKETLESLKSGRQYMKQMLEAMEEIDNSSAEIGKIMKTVDDIALQTNLLALNAAVEAARAGDAGKGFAVVADEVRSLAGKCQEASQTTSQLIESTLHSVAKGTAMARQTSESIEGIIDSSVQSVSLVERISQESSSQAASLEEVKLGIDQIEGVVQTNSAAAEESAAASEELSAQALTLKGLVGKFRLKGMK